MKKDFDKWNKIKKVLEKRPDVFCNQREIWWCSIGANVGAEASGKNDLFERPVLILRIYSMQSIVAAPLTSKPKDDIYHEEIHYDNKMGCVILSHARTISPRRLQRKMCRLDKKQFKEVFATWVSLLKNESAPLARSLGARRPDGRIILSRGSKSRRKWG